MYKNQLQELAQRSCFSLPSYVCTREGPDHAPRFRAAVTFNGETFEGPSGCTTLRQAEHAAAEVALARLSLRGPSTSLAALVLDETGVYKNLLQETAHRAGLKLPAYTTVRSGPGHSPVFASTVELAGMSFAGDPARTKKQAEKNAAMAAWSSLKQMPEARKDSGAGGAGDEQEHVVVARVLAALKPRDDGDGKAVPLPKHCGTGSSPSALPNPSLYRHQWRPRNAPAQLRTVPQQPAGPRILPPLHLLPQPASSSRDAAAAELVRMLERAMARDRAAEAMPPSPCYYAPASAYHYGGAPRSFAAGGFHAPAVSVRSVIPVCAAPPPPPSVANQDERNGPAKAAAAGKRV
ncbi:double-stranded RNA-binding protein 3-like [Phragmites australis]|uniref:double-stranded RNA-binding protein 3-like n=1 Tax=Phragmites australis TaxID=29695 RepID=UPI002D779116|nr:double-stranded RNA-binding protein 3-like [Phragmites australis]